MAQIKAAEVAKLRKATGAGMMDCKKALTESEGDFDKAIDYLRKKGQKVANKRSDRDAAEGVVLANVSDDAKFGAVVVLNCETDFVAKNDDFVKLADRILTEAIKQKPANIDALKALPYGDYTIGEEITNQVGVIGEKVELSFYETIATDKVVAYIHPGNRLASLVGLNMADVDTQIGRDVAMQVAAMNPVALNKESVSEVVVAKEIEIGKELAIREGKPEAMAEKIAMGRLNKFFKESTLLSQQFVKDNKTTVDAHLKSINKNLTVVEFKRYSLA